MTRRALLIAWRVDVVVVAASGVAVVAAAVSPKETRSWISLLVMALLIIGFVVLWRCRPRTFDLGWLSPRATKDLEALDAGEPVETEVRREFALDLARRNVFGGFSSLPVWAMQAVLWGSYSWSPLWLRAGVLPLVVVGLVYSLYRLAQRVRAVDRYEATVPAGTIATSSDT